MNGSVSLGNIKYSLKNSENYKTHIGDTHFHVLEKYTTLIHEYMKMMIDTTTMKNKSYFKFIFLRGLETISHVFHMLLFYTRNLDVTYYNSQKALYYYIEFIGQISNVQTSYLELSSNDAVLYVYSKTIYDILPAYKKNTPVVSLEERETFDILRKTCVIYKNILHFILNQCALFQNNDKEQILHMLGKLESWSFQWLNSSSFSPSQSEKMYQWIDTWITQDDLTGDALLTLLQNHIV